MREANSNRRAFLSQGAVATVAATQLSTFTNAHAAGSDILKVGLVGCGGRGTGAAEQALTADSNTKLVAMADAFPDRIEESLNALSQATPPDYKALVCVFLVGGNDGHNTLVPLTQAAYNDYLPARGTLALPDNTGPLLPL